MKNCTGCKYAEWDRDKLGRLHKSGYGKCAYPYKVPPLPASMYWLGKLAPKPLGGAICRLNDLEEHCPYFVWENQ